MPLITEPSFQLQHIILLKTVLENRFLSVLTRENHFLKKDYAPMNQLNMLELKNLTYMVNTQNFHFYLKMHNAYIWKGRSKIISIHKRI